MLNKQSALGAGTKFVLFACAAAAALSVSDGALAQATDTTRSTAAEVDTVIVTARRKEESLQSVPVSVAAVSSAQLQKQAVTNLFELSRVAPGLTVTPSALGITRPAYQLRGQRASATRITADPAIVVYFAEVGTSRAAGSPQSLFDLESVQVLKGPQGTLFGRNTTGGAILVTPKAPSNEFEGYVQGTIGSYSRRSFEGVLNVPVSDQLAIRAAVLTNRRDGYTRNTLPQFPNQKSFDDDNQSYRLSVRVKPTESITSDFIATYFYSNVTGLQVRLSDVVPAGVAPLPGLLANLQSELAISNGLGFYEYRATRPARAKDDVKTIQNTTVFDLGDSVGILGDAKLKNIIAYRKLKNLYTTNSDATILGIFDTGGTFRGKQFSEELQLQGVTGKLDYVAGAFYSEESGVDLTDSQLFNALPRNLTDLYGKNKSTSAFVHGNYDLASVTEGLSLSAGVRYTQDKRLVDTHNRQQRVPTAAAPYAFACTAFATIQQIASLQDRNACSLVTRAKFSEPTWDVSLNWQVDPDHLLYVAHRHGYRSGSASTATAPTVRPEKVNDIEFGSKNQFRVGDMPVRLNVVGYYGKYKDLQRNITVVLNGVAATQDRNAADAHVYGVETELNVRFNDYVSVGASYALTKAVYDSFNDVFPSPTGPITVDNSGARFAYTPEHMANINLNVDLPLAADMGQASVSIGYAYQSKFQTTESNSPNCGPGGIEKLCLNAGGLLPGYGLVNARVDWRRPMGAPFDVAVFGTNLADNKYLAGKFELASILGFGASWPGAPRMVGVELRVPFGAAR